MDDIIVWYRTCTYLHWETVDPLVQWLIILYNIDGWAQDSGKSSVLVMEFEQFYDKLAIFHGKVLCAEKYVCLQHGAK